MDDELHIIDPKQFGNLKGSSVSHYLVDMMDTIHKNIDKGGTSVNLCTVDFSKAFDHVNHTTVVEKLIQLEVNPAILPTICSFLTGRTQSVRYHGAISTPLRLTCGVPQGTKLGPILFLAMVNDAANDIQHRWKYVDDLSVVEIRQ